MIKKLINKRAEGYIDVAVTVLVISFVLMLIFCVWSMATIKQDMRYMANELIEVASVTGKASTEVQQRYEELCTEIGFKPALNITASYFDKNTGKVQLGDRITITLTAQMTLRGFGDFTLPFNVEVKKSGLSRIYWK